VRNKSTFEKICPRINTQSRQRDFRGAFQHLPVEPASRLRDLGGAYSLESAGLWGRLHGTLGAVSLFIPVCHVEHPVVGLVCSVEMWKNKGAELAHSEERNNR
jgi:hypothetical protein